MKNPYLFFVLTFALSSQSIVSYAVSLFDDIEIKMGKVVFLLPPVAQAYSDREATIAPREYEQAEQLRALLAENNKEEVLRQLNTFYDIELSPAMLMLKAQIYLSLEQYTQAEKVIRTVLSRQPQLIRAHISLGQLYLLQDKFEQARTHFAKAVSFGANDSYVYGQLGYLNLKLYGAHSAIPVYQQAMAIEPDNVQWQQGLLTALTKAELFSAALSMTQHLLQNDPINKALWINQAAIALKVENKLLALASLEMAMLLGNKTLDNIQASAQIHMQLKSYHRASELIQQYLKGKNYRLSVLSPYLEWLEAEEQWQTAETLLNVALKLNTQLSNKEKSVLSLHEANIQAKKKLNPKANALYQRALSLNPSNTKALLDYAEFKFNQKSYSEAELLYIRGEAYDSIKKQAILGRVQVNVTQKDYPSALEQLKKAYRLFPDLIDLKRDIDTLESITRATQKM